MAGCRGDGVPYSQLTNGSNISVGGWGAVPNNTTLGSAHCHIPLCVRANGPVLRYRQMDTARLLAHVSIALPLTREKTLMKIYLANITIHASMQITTMATAKKISRVSNSWTQLQLFHNYE
jgi:hypothetical protein